MGNMGGLSKLNRNLTQDTWGLLSYSVLESGIFSLRLFLPLHKCMSWSKHAGILPQYNTIMLGLNLWSQKQRVEHY